MEVKCGSEAYFKTIDLQQWLANKFQKAKAMPGTASSASRQFPAWTMSRGDEKAGRNTFLVSRQLTWDIKLHASSTTILDCK